MNLKEIKELVDLVALHGLGGLEVERAGFRLRIEGPRPEMSHPVRNGGIMDVQVERFPSLESGALAPASSEPEAALPAAAAKSADAARQHVLTSPIVGTFYRSANPDSEPFVSVGSSVEKGATLCIIEAMKLMNEIEADVAGTIAAVHPQNGQPVEYGEKLFTIVPR